jgi:leucyl-tRNA synthetase
MVKSSDELDENKFNLREEYKAAEFICDDNGKYIVGRSRKMSKSKYNVVTRCYL